jgi:sugar/nucleoside kinase (ribokinase family)
MCRDLNIVTWAVTRGKNGVVWHDRNSDGVIKASQINAIDTLGAGDIFHGAFCHSYLKTRDFKQSLEVANDIAGRSCSTIGTRSWMNE